MSRNMHRDALRPVAAGDASVLVERPDDEHTVLVSVQIAEGGGIDSTETGLSVSLAALQATLDSEYAPALAFAGAPGAGLEHDIAAGQVVNIDGDTGESARLPAIPNDGTIVSAYVCNIGAGAGASVKSQGAGDGIYPIAGAAPPYTLAPGATVHIVSIPGVERWALFEGAF